MRAFILVAALGLAACQTPCPAGRTEAIQAVFHCEDGSDLQVTFQPTPDGVLVVQEGYTAVQLPARGAGAGYRYADNGAQLRGSGREARWTRPGAAETVCERTN
jgi:hypothetical protein